MRPLTDVEYAILDVLYFAEPFENILKEVAGDANVVADSLKILIDVGYVLPMMFDDEKQDFIQTFMYDADNMHNFRYIITRDGLNAHNSRPRNA
jgi:hypothetical protein